MSKRAKGGEEQQLAQRAVLKVDLSGSRESRVDVATWQAGRSEAGYVTARERKETKITPTLVALRPLL